LSQGFFVREVNPATSVAAATVTTTGFVQRERLASSSHEEISRSFKIDFCAYFVLTGNVKQSSLQAGYSEWWGYELLKMPQNSAHPSRVRKAKTGRGMRRAAAKFGIPQTNPEKYCGCGIDSSELVKSNPEPG
jgi:hypothetical protein